MAEHIVRDSYGVRAGLPAAVVPFGYTGHAEDPTGLVWGRARCYAPTTGAWTGEDPVFTEGRYGYVAGATSYARDLNGQNASVEYAGLLAGGCAVGAIVAFVGEEIYAASPHPSFDGSAQSLEALLGGCVGVALGVPGGPLTSLGPWSQLLAGSLGALGGGVLGDTLDDRWGD